MSSGHGRAVPAPPGFPLDTAASYAHFVNSDRMEAANASEGFLLKTVRAVTFRLTAS